MCMWCIFLWEVYFNKLPVSQTTYIAPNGLKSSGLKGTSKEAIMLQSSYCPAVLNETEQSLNQSSRCPDGDSNSALF
jgi:hypothetical protein